MKRLLVITLTLFLCSCGKTINIDKELNDVFLNNNYAMTKANNYSDYINYYLPSDINEIDSEDLSYTFDIDNCKLIMNINLSYIFNKYYYNDSSLQNEGFFDEDKLIYSREGEILDIKFSKIPYFFKVYRFDNECILYLTTSELTLYGYCHYSKIKLLAEKMLQMVKYSWVNTDKVISDYSTKDIIEYNKNIVNLFEQNFPKDGSVEDIIFSPEQVIE